MSFLHMQSSATNYVLIQYSQIGPSTPANSS